jgi:thermitase
MKSSTLSAVLIALALGSVAKAQTAFILRPTATASVTTIAARHNLAVVRPLDTADSVYLVTGAATVPVAQVESDVSSDTDVTDIEPDQPTAVPELTQSTGVILDQLPPPSATTYAGTSVLSSYLAQPAAQIVNLWTAQSAFHVTGAGTVAVIDTGVDPTSTVLAPSLVSGYDFIHNTPGMASDWSELGPNAQSALQASNPSPASKSDIALLNQSTGVILDQSTGVILDGQIPAEFGHGTMVAGVIHLVAPTAKIMPLKAFTAAGTAQLSDILRAIYYAADHGAQIINMSFTLLQPSEELNDAVQYAHNAGSICIAAAGNSGASQVPNPANLDKVMGIASTSLQDTVSKFTNYGDGVFLGAPGENIITTYPGNNYAQVSGTSFSTPFVAGATALLYQLLAQTDFGNMKDNLSHAVSVSDLIGNGRLDINQALQAAAAGSSDN